MSGVDLLAIAAHPDDAEIGCGGALQLAVASGRRTGVVDLTAGEAASRGTTENRRREQTRASEILGLSHRVCLGLPDTAVGTDPSHVMAVVEAIRECRPRVVVAPYPRDRHPDHAAAGRLAREACFLARVRNVGTEEPHTVTRLHHYMLHEPFAPSFVLDITSVWERKLAAILAYQSQFGSGDGAQTQISAPSFPRMLEARAIYHGSMVGAAWGEAYHHLGPIGMDQLPEGPSSPEHYNMFS